MSYTTVAKPSTSNYSATNAAKPFFDDPSIFFDDPRIFFDGNNANAYTAVAKPTSSNYTSVNKPT